MKGGKIGGKKERKKKKKKKGTSIAPRLRLTVNSSVVRPNNPSLSALKPFLPFPWIICWPPWKIWIVPLEEGDSAAAAAERKLLGGNSDVQPISTPALATLLRDITILSLSSFITENPAQGQLAASWPIAFLIQQPSLPPIPFLPLVNPWLGRRSPACSTRLLVGSSMPWGSCITRSTSTKICMTMVQAIFGISLAQKSEISLTPEQGDGNRLYQQYRGFLWFYHLFRRKDDRPDSEFWPFGYPRARFLKGGPWPYSPVVTWPP